MASSPRRPLGTALDRSPLAAALVLLALAAAPMNAQAASLGGHPTMALVSALGVWVALLGITGDAAVALLPATAAALALGLGVALMRHGRYAKHGPRASTLAAGATAGAAASLDTGALLSGARRQFVQLQAAWDAGDVPALAALTTPEVLDDLCRELPQRGPGPNRTEVLMLDARLLALDELDSVFVASIEFSGLIREAPGQDAAPFKEIWLMLRPRDAGSAAWRLARQQALF